MRDLWGKCMDNTTGQMTVELAIVLPVMLVMAFIVANLMSYLEACLVFDRVAPDAVTSFGVASSGEQLEDSLSQKIQAAIEQALGRKALCRVEVSSSFLGKLRGAGAQFSLGPDFTRYTCTLYYIPWPHSFVIAGQAFTLPPVLSHTRSLVVDRYRPGVVM